MQRTAERDFFKPKYGGKIWVDAHGSCSYQCEFCKETFDSAKKFEYHMLMDHGRQLRQEQMKTNQDIDSEETRREQNGRRMSSTYVKAGPKRSNFTDYKGEKISKLACNKCTMTFYNLERLRAHAREKHIHECVYCPRDATKSFETLKGLQNHQRNDHESKFPHQCSICPRAFKRSHQLKEHIEGKHTRGHDVKCDFCPTILKSMFQKKNHTKQEHSDRRYYCHLCTEYRTNNEDNLRRHTREKHPGRKQPTDW